MALKERGHADVRRLRDRILALRGRCRSGLGGHSRANYTPPWINVKPRAVSQHQAGVRWSLRKRLAVPRPSATSIGRDAFHRVRDLAGKEWAAVACGWL